MQVTHTEDHVTHAVIGGAKAMDMGISDSAEFFHILSSTLYSDQKLAVVRETVCNAWDAHIESNRTHLPIEITLTSDTITIRDHGLGIPSDLIIPIYGIYGASTKKNNGSVTGGFGLGCKSPFAYTDNFQVTSFCEGVRTIYNMSKSSAVVGGKPSIIPIASFPTTETGLEVVIRLTDKQHFSVFKELFQQIVWNGGIRATLNGVAMDTVKSYAIKENFFITNHKVISHNSKVAINYGNVIYPLESHNQYHKELIETVKIIDSLQSGYRSHYKICLVLIAPSNSISVTPSRESLSMQSHTVNTVTALLQNFINEVKKARKNLMKPIITDSVKEAVRKKNYEALLNDHTNLPCKIVKNLINSSDACTVYNHAHLAKLYYSTSYPTELSGYDLKLRVSELMKAKHTPAGLGQSFLRAHAHKSTSWVNKHVIYPVLRKMVAEPTMSPDRLLVYGLHKRYAKDTIYKASEVGKVSLEISMPMLRNTILLSYTRKDVDLRMQNSVELRALGYGGIGLMYIVPRNQPRVDEALKFFQSQGYRVIDLTKPQKGETASSIAPIRVSKPYTKSTPGLPLVSNAVGLSRFNIIATEFWNDKLPRIEDPEYVILCTISQSGSKAGKFNNFSSNMSLIIAKYFGSVGGVAKTTLQEERLIKKGAKSIYEFLIPKVCAYIQNSPEILSAYSCSNLESTYATYSPLTDRIMCDAQVLADLGFMIPMTQEAKDYLAMWEGIKHINQNQELLDTRKYLEDIPKSLTLIDFINKINSSKKVRYVNSLEVVSGLTSREPKTKQTAMDLLKFILS